MQISYKKQLCAKWVSTKSIVVLLCLLAVACHRKSVPEYTLGGSGRLHTEMGYASYYADKFEGRKTASGEAFHQSAFTAAHKHLPFGTQVSVINLSNQKSVIVRINDRGPFVRGRIIDLSKSAAKSLDMLRSGVAKVKIEYRK
ncbi:septal ring lytic transglycosylase RlpA family protein [Hydrotalea sp.]|uniref:septal ring lytic transglycosylase RlpA family protein n=1 Tax=Hydrotalea sp. TaxID=2881279 RepID=UPI002605579B|nr:septal ring lytic transglycosylase RlpA family protein [Hydrotalea sp.]